MKKLKAFVATAVIGGLVVLVPIGITVFIFTWLFNLIAGAIEPLTELVAARSELGSAVAGAVVIACLVGGCFLVGLQVRTRLGGWLFALVERCALKRAPGYSLVKETVKQFIGEGKSPFGTVALAQIFGNETLVSAFVTDRHADGSYTVFIPTGPNPTSGNIYHLAERFVHPVDVPVEDAMRSIISCGAGSSKLIEAYANKAPGRQAGAKGT